MTETNLDRLLLKMLAEQNQNSPLPRLLTDKRRLLRALMNTRPPMPADPELIQLQDEELQAQLAEKGAVTVAEMPDLPRFPRLRLWQGDITRLKVGAIVNAANNELLGCFSLLHNCIDNAIHSASGIQLRMECARLMQGAREKAGNARITPAYNLPCAWVIHTVGPMVPDGRPDGKDCATLADCYKNCLKLAQEKELQSLAFCAISTGVFGFPAREAAMIAVSTVLAFLEKAKYPEIVVFDVFSDRDLELYGDVIKNAGSFSKD